MICYPTLGWHDCLQPAARFLFEKLVRDPCRGAVAISRGLRLVVPVVTEAVRRAVDAQLSPEARVRLQDGLAAIQSGWCQVRWALLVLVAVCGRNVSAVMTAVSLLFVVV